jgi:hypothetical protein
MQKVVVIADHLVVTEVQVDMAEVSSALEETD